MSSDAGDLPALVIDGGSGSFKTGFSGEDEPTAIFPSTIGTHQIRQDSTTHIIESFVGRNITTKHDSLTLRYPIEHGIVTNWDDFEQLLAHSFEGLHADPEEHMVLMSDPPLNPRPNKEQTTELMFEGFNIPAFYLANSSQLNLYSSGRSSGIVTDIGDGITSTVPFYESHCFSSGIHRQDFGGRDLSLYLQRLLQERGLSFTTTSELELVRELKENVGFVAPASSSDTSGLISSVKKSFTLPDGNVVTLDNERFQCPEALFDPSLAGHSHLKGLTDLILSSLMVCDVDVRPDMCVGILICGGCALFSGFKDRLKVELEAKMPSSRKVRVVPVAPLVYGPWIGGSILSSLSTFQSHWVSKQEYHEYGPSIVLRR